jgi:hypothetical protein
VFTRAFHWPLSYVRSIQSLLHNPISLRIILTLFIHLYLGLHCGLSLSAFPTNSYSYVIITYKHFQNFHKIPFCSTELVSMFLLITNEHSVNIYKVYTVLPSGKKVFENTRALKEKALHHSVRLLTLKIISDQFSFIP